MTDPGTPAGETLARLRAALRAGMKSKDKTAVSALRSALAAVANAEAVEVPDDRPDGESTIAKARTGVGAGEAARRTLGAADIEKILDDEIGSRHEIARQLEESGHPDRAEHLRAEADAIAAALVTD